MLTEIWSGCAIDASLVISVEYLPPLSEDKALAISRHIVINDNSPLLTNRVTVTLKIEAVTFNDSPKYRVYNLKSADLPQFYDVVDKINKAGKEKS